MKVKVIYSKFPDLWYAVRVGQVFEVRDRTVDTRNGRMFVKEDGFGGIYTDDAEVIPDVVVPEELFEI